MKDFMKQTMNRFSIFTMILVFGLGIMTSCSSSEKSSNGEQSSNDGTKQVKPKNAENKPPEIQSAENKTVSEKEILWDFRKDDNFKSPTFSKEETAAVVKYLFGDQATGKIEIRNRLSGSFTKPNAKETLYYLSGCRDEESKQFTIDCPHVSWDSVGWIAIFDGTTPILKINEALGFAVEKATDVNGDGKNELLSFSGYTQSGIQTQGAALGQISDSKYQEIRNFKG